MRLSAALLAFALSASCGDATGPGARVIGSWSAPREDLGSGLSRAQSVVFRADGFMDDEIRIYQSGRLTDTYRWTYAYEVRGDSLFTRPIVRAMLDVNGVWTRFDRSRFEVRGSRLVLTYPWFGPADEPITVTTVFFRAGCLQVGLIRCP